MNSDSNNCHVDEDYRLEEEEGDILMKDVKKKAVDEIDNKVKSKKRYSSSTMLEEEDEMEEIIRHRARDPAWIEERRHYQKISKTFRNYMLVKLNECSFCLGKERRFGLVD
jgi:hypothetical protein